MRYEVIKKELCVLFALLLIFGPIGSHVVHAAQISPDTVIEQIEDMDTDDVVPGDSGEEEPPAEDDRPALMFSSLHLVAGGDPYILEVERSVSADYSFITGDASIAGLSDQDPHSVTITPLKAGSTVLEVAAYGYGGVHVVLTCEITISDISLDEQPLEIYKNDAQAGKQIMIDGLDLAADYYGTGDSLSDHPLCSVYSENDSVATASFNEGKVCIDGNGRGTTTIHVHIFGRDFSIPVKVYYYTLNKYAVNTYPGGAKRTLKIKGAGSHKVTWQSGDPAIAKVSAKGVVTPKSIGATKITAKVNGRKIVCMIAVSSKTALRVVKKAKAISKRENVYYSQAYRMSENYYDCSSLVYRCYKPYGIRFGYTHPSWAPTAAEEGRWCATTGHLVARKSVNIMKCKLLPGDTIYYSFNGNNGRYLNIDHTAIFAGYGYNEATGYYGTVIEASSSNNSVVERMYYPGSSIMLIGRPCKN